MGAYLPGCLYAEMVTRLPQQTIFDLSRSVWLEIKPKRN